MESGILNALRPYRIFFLHLLLSPCLGFTQDLFPAYPSEITYKDGVAYLNENRFTGLLVQEKTNKSIGEFRNGLRIGYFLDYFDNGNKKYEGNFENGTIQGLYKEWYSNGNLKYEIEYEAGKFNGSYKEYYENEVKRYEGNYVNGQKAGIHSSYYPNGQKNVVISWSRDKVLGLYTSFFENGNKHIEYTQDLSGKNGEYTEWFENGNIKVIYKYNKDNITDGPYTVYGVSGNKEKIELYRAGIKVKESLFIDGSLLDSVTDFFPNSKQIKAQGLKKDGLRDGLWITWYENGQKQAEVNYKYDKRNGASTEWYDNGDKKLEAVYENDILTKTIYNNPINPANSIQNKLKKGSYLFCVTSMKDADSAFIMVTFNFSNSDINENFKRNILNALDSRFDIISNQNINRFSRKQLRYNFEFSNPEYSTLYDDGTSSQNLLGAALNVKFAGYRGKISLSLLITDIVDNRTLASYDLNPLSIIYATRDEAINNLLNIELYQLMGITLVVYPVKAIIMNSSELDHKGRVKSVIINKGLNVGLVNKFTLYVYLDTNTSDSVGRLQIESVDYNTSVCKIDEGQDIITSYLNQNKNLICILSDKIIEK